MKKEKLEHENQTGKVKRTYRLTYKAIKGDMQRRATAQSNLRRRLDGIRLVGQPGETVVTRSDPTVSHKAWNRLMHALHGNTAKTNNNRNKARIAVKKEKEKREKTANRKEKDDARKRKSESQYRIRMLALNGCGIKAEPMPEASNATPEAGEALKCIPGIKLQEVIDLMKGGGIHITVLNDTHQNEEEAKAVAYILRNMGYGSFYTEGTMNDKTRTRGVMVIWDLKEILVNEDDETLCNVLEEGRIVRVNMEFIRDGRALTVLGVYMPVRSGSSTEEVEHSWEVLNSALLEENGPVAIGGDLNAETQEWLEKRGAKHITRSDNLLEELMEDHELVAKARSATYRTGTQIDNWLINESLDRYMGNADTIPGVCGRDHQWVVMNYYVDIEAITDRIDRPMGSPASKMDKDMCKEFNEGVLEYVDEAVKEATFYPGTTVSIPGQSYATVLMVFQAAVMKFARDIVGRAQKKKNEEREDRDNEENEKQNKKDEDAVEEDGITPASVKTRPRIKTTKRERYRWRVAKWIRMTNDITRWSGALTKKWEGRGFWKEETFKVNETLLLDPNLSNKQRRQKALDLCNTQYEEALKNFNEASKSRGDEIVQQMEEAVTQNAGKCMIAMFKILRKACGKEDSGGAKIMTVYEDDDKEKGVEIRGPGMRQETVKIMTKINAKREADLPAVRELLGWLKEYPEDKRGELNLEKDVFSWEECEKAINKIKKGKGLGTDGFDGYLLREGPDELRRMFHTIIKGIITSQEYPPEWNQWIAMLAMKPGEDPKELGRRRDLWLQCHSEKCVVNMLRKHYDKIAWETVPSSQAGFTKNRNAPEHTLTYRILTEQSMTETSMCFTGFIDAGTFFMSCVNDIVWEVEQWSGVAPEVTDVMKALREGLTDAQGKKTLAGLTGKFETEYGLTDAVPIEQGLGQGDGSSPVRSKLMLGVVQQVINRLCPGCPMRMDGRRLALLFYADDALIKTDSIHTLQLAFECAWLVMKIMGIKIQIKGKKKTCWAGTYWEEGKEKDITGWEMRLPDNTIIPQLVSKTPEGKLVNETYKYLGTEMRAGWAEGRGQDETRHKMVSKCRQLIGLIGRTPLETLSQMEKAISLAISGTIGYYGRSTSLTWDNSIQIEKARVQAVKGRGFTEGVPRLSLYDTVGRGGIGHEHAYSIGLAAMRDQIDRALCGREGEPARAAVEDAIARTCRNLGCRGIHPLEWRPTHLEKELSEDLIIESYIAGMLKCGWRGKLTNGGKRMNGPLKRSLWGMTLDEQYMAGPRIWEEQKDVWNTEGKRCTFSRRLAAAGIATWADISDKKTGEWLTPKQVGDIYGLENAIVAEYKTLIEELKQQ